MSTPKTGNFHVYCNGPHHKYAANRWQFWYRKGRFHFKSANSYASRDGAIAAIQRFVASIGDATISYLDDK